MRLRDSLLAILGRGPAAARHKGAPGFAGLGAVVGVVIAASSVGPERYLAFAVIGFGCAAVGGVIGLLIPEPTSATWVNNTNGSLRLLAGVGCIFMLIGSIVKLAETGKLAFVSAVVFTGSGAIGAFTSSPRGKTGLLIILLGFALGSFLLFMATGDLFGIFAGIMFCWPAIRLLKMPTSNPPAS